MPRRRYRRRRRRRGKPLNSRVARLEKIAKQTSPEAKYSGAAFATGAAHGGYLQELINIPVGDEDVQRNGDSVFIDRLQMHYTCNSRSLAADNVRVIVFWDKENTVLNISDFWDAAFLGVANAPQGFKNHDNRFETKVLYDKFHSITPTASNSNIRVMKTVKVKAHTQFESGTTVIRTGSLKVVVIGSAAAAADNPNFQFVGRIHYIDP